MNQEPGASTNMMRRSSFSPMSSLSSQQSGEPLIVVEESSAEDGFEEREGGSGESRPPTPPFPPCDPFLLSPYRDIRKRSLPTPQCTSGITASQVRRLSDQGGTSGPSPREAAFLATLTQAPAPGTGGRRHSVVTISRAPPTLFGRNRRESFAAFPTTGFPLPGRLNRRDSSSSIARSPSGSGSSFNLQLDIMDDIAEIKAARKVRMKMWKDVDSKERICEVQPIDGGQSSRYCQSGKLGKDRRYSDISSLNQGTVSGLAKPRRASELPPIPSRTTTPPPSVNKNAGIVCSNNDLMSIMTSLTSSAQEINVSSKGTELSSAASSGKSILSSKRSLLKNTRSNSFDVSMLPKSKDKKTASETKSVPSNWINKRHQPLATKRQDNPPPSAVVVTFTDNEKSPKNIVSNIVANPLESETEPKETVDKLSKVIWDKPTGSTVDPAVLGSVIEDFLNKKTSDSPTTQTAKPAPKPGQNTTVAIEITDSQTQQPQTGMGPVNQTKAGDEDTETEKCNTSLCSTIKDLFVK